MKTFSERFKAKEQKQHTNLLEIQLIENKSLKKLLPIIGLPAHKMSQRERVKVTRLKEVYPEFSLPSKQDEHCLLFITLGPLYYLNVEKFKYTYRPKPAAKPLMKESSIKKELQELTKLLQEELGLTAKFKNIFKKDGTKVTDIYQLCEGDITFFISSKDFFIGVEAALKKHPQGMFKFFKEVDLLYVSLPS